jgi:hypothetical protein
MNHVVPFFAHFDDAGMWQPEMVAPVPVEGSPAVVMSDYLTSGETTAWRHGEPVADLAALGAAMANDPDVTECMVARVWNYAMGKGDIVAALALVPSEVIRSQLNDLRTNGYRLKAVIRDVFTSDDFVKF